MSVPLTEQLVAFGDELACAREAGEVEDEIGALLGMAAVSLELDDPGGAHGYAKLAERRIRDADAGRARLAEALGLQARSMRRRGQLDRALDLFTAAEEAAHEYAAAYEEARWIAHQAAIYAVRDELDAAETALHRARALLEPEESTMFDVILHRPRLTALAELEGEAGIVCLQRGEGAAAEDHYRLAVEHAQAAEDLAAVATWAVNLGKACARRRLVGEAEQYFAQAHAAARKSGSERLLVKAAAGRAAALRLAHRHGAAADVLIELADEVSRREAQADLLLSALKSLTFTGAWERMRRIGEELLPLSQSLGATPEQHAEVEHVLEPARRALREPGKRPQTGPTTLDFHIPQRMAEAEDASDAESMAEVAHLVCDVKWGLGTTSEAAWRDVLTDPSLRHRVVGDAMFALCEKGEAVRSLELSQRYKALEYAQPSLRLALEDPAGAEEKSLLDALKHLREAVKSLKGPAPWDGFVLVERVREAGERLLEACEMLRERDPLRAARLGAPIRPDDLLDAFPLNSPVAVVDLFLTTRGMLAHLVVRGLRVSVIPLAFTAFGGKEGQEAFRIWAHHGLSKSLGPFQAEGLAKLVQLLHDRLTCPLARDIAERGLTQLILIPDPLIRQLPLHLGGVCGNEIRVAGVDTTGARVLSELFPVEYASCLGVVCTSQLSKRPRALEKVIALANPRGDIPGAAAATAWLGKQTGEVAYEEHVGAAATRDAFARSLDEADLVVVTTHGQLEDQRPEESRLAFSDGDWRLAELAERPPLGRDPLIVLSACQVGTPPLTTDEAIAGGFPGCLVACGAASVLGAQWPLEDVSTGFLLERFMAHLGHRGYRPSAALFRATRDIRRLRRDEILARVDSLLAEIAKAEPSAPIDRTWVLLDNLREWVADYGGEHPFEGPAFWGGVIVVGSGWHLPAGGQVGGAADTLQSISFLIKDQPELEELLKVGRFAKARARAEDLLPRAEGANRAFLLSVLARSIWDGRRPWMTASARRKALAYAAAGKRIARAEEDDQRVAYFDQLEAAIAAEGSAS